MKQTFALKFYVLGVVGPTCDLSSHQRTEILKVLDDATSAAETVIVHVWRDTSRHGVDGDRIVPGMEEIAGRYNRDGHAKHVQLHYLECHHESGPCQIDTFKACDTILLCPGTAHASTKKARAWAAKRLLAKIGLRYRMVFAWTTETSGRLRHN